MSQKIQVFINRKEYYLEDPLQTGTSLKKLADIPLEDVLFLQQPGEDQVIPNETKVTLKDGDHLHSQPPADYGSAAAEFLSDSGLAPERVALHDEASRRRRGRRTRAPVAASHGRAASPPGRKVGWCTSLMTRA